MTFRNSSGRGFGIDSVGASALLVLFLTISAQAEIITLVGGDVINAQIIEEFDDHIVVVHEALGRIEISRDRIDSIVVVQPPDSPETEVEQQHDAKAVELTGAEASEEAAAEAEQTDAPEADELSSPKPVWKSSFTLGGAGSWGNTDSQSLTMGINSVRDAVSEITKIDLSYYLDLSNGDRTDNRFTAGIRHDWLQPESNWLTFIQSRFDYDEFQSWDYRLAGHVGVGYRAINEENFKLIPRIGVGGSKEWKSDDDNIRPELLVGMSLDWTISDKQSITADTTIYPDLDDHGEFRTLSTASWSVLMDEALSMSLTAGVTHEYQSEVDLGVDKNDTRAFVGLKFVF
ncbi:MAG: DUF481 domain-containing protein [Planctomycetota bacterium]|nr:DUF481 domain-containing protein [Planctomycetota bacterium]